MSKLEKILLAVLRGNADNNIKFEDLRNLLLRLHFNERVKGSHHIFYKDGLEEIINIQSADNKAKSYQVKQVRNLIIKYKLEIDGK